jgi:hypothetical protein
MSVVVKEVFRKERDRGKLDLLSQRLRRLISYVYKEKNKNKIPKPRPREGPPVEVNYN